MCDRNECHPCFDEPPLNCTVRTDFSAQPDLHGQQIADRHLWQSGSGCVKQPLAVYPWQFLLPCHHEEVCVILHANQRAQLVQWARKSSKVRVSELTHPASQEV